MKLKLLAAAALALTGTAAMAQSSVTIYGRIDLSVGSLKELGQGSKTQMFNGGDGGLTTSRIGFKGEEDLGGGTKAIFKLEQRINANDGSLQSPSFKGESSLGVKGGFGIVRAGRMTTQLDDVRALGNSQNVFDSAFTPGSNGVYKSGGDYSSRFNNQIRYESPNMGGFYGGLSYAFEQTTGEKDTMNGLLLGYKNGPIEVALARQDEKGSDTDYVSLSGAYDFGAAAISGGYNRRNGTDASGKDDEYTVGVTVPAGAFKFSAGYAGSKTTIGGATAGKASGYAIGGTYSMSKRTRVYAGLRQVQVKDGNGTKTADTRLFALGVRHDF